MKEINLFTLSSNKKFDLLLLKKVFFKVALIFLSVNLLIAAATFFIFFSSDKKMKSNQLKIRNLKTEVNKYLKNESYLVTIDDRTSVIEALFLSKKEVYGVLNDIEPLLVPDFALSGVEISKNKGLVVNGVCLNASSLANLNNKTDEFKREKIFSSVIVSSVNRSKTGYYEVGLELKK